MYDDLQKPQIFASTARIMSRFLQPFKFPKRLWLVISAAVFLYLFFGVRVGLPGKFPPDFTTWKALVAGAEAGHIFMGFFFALFWLVCAFGFGAIVAAILGIVSQLFRNQNE